MDCFPTYLSSQVRFDEHRSHCSAAGWALAGVPPTPTCRVENLRSRGDMDRGVTEDSRVVDPTREGRCLLRGIRGPLGDRFVGRAADDRHDSGPGRMHPHPVQRTHVQVERDHRMAITDQPFHHRSPDATARTRHHIRPRHGVPVCTRSAARSAARSAPRSAPWSALSYGSGSLNHMNSQMNTDSFLRWLAGNEKALRTPGTDALRDEFTRDTP
jgi:hypothetical protein